MLHIARLMASLALLATAAYGQAGGPLDDILVSPLPGPASCYGGTGGADHVMFLRANPLGDCDIFGGGSPCLNRREFPGDGVNGRAVSLLAAIVQRPSVTGAGDFVGFSEFGFNVCLMATASEDSEVCFGRDQIVIDPHSISIHPAGTALGLTQLDDFSFIPLNLIYVANPNTFALLEPVYQLVVAGPGGDLLQVETVDFTVDGDYLIVDAFNPVTGLWAIYAVSRKTAATVALVAPVPGLQIRNPALAQTSDDHLVFDAQITATGANVVFAANLLTGALSPVATTTTLGYPSYTGDDAAVAFTDGDNAVASLVSIDLQPVAVDRLTPVGARSRWLTNGGVPEVYRRGAWDGTLADPALCAGIVDSDGDGVADPADNCSATPNPAQIDADGDGYGNACDADFNGDCIVNFADLGVLKAVFFTADAQADLNGDGVVNAGDLAVVKARFFAPPGPSGVTATCD